MLIRPEYIREYHKRYKAHKEGQTRLSRQSEEEVSALNARWGKPGSSSMLRHHDQEYYPEYKALRTTQDERWNAYNREFDEWYQSSDVTIAEFLFLDNLSLALDLFSLVNKNDFDAMWHDSFIRAKVRAYIERWKEEHNLGGLRSMVDHEIDTIQYAERRCKRHFDIRPWHLGKQRGIKYYRDRYTKTLREELDWLRF